MLFQYIAQVIIAHQHADAVVNHYHLWHVALAFLVPCSVLVLAGIHILDLRKALRDTEEGNIRLTTQVAAHRGLVFSVMRNLRELFEPLQDVAARLKEADASLQGAGDVMAGKMQEIGTLLQIVNTAHERNQRDTQSLDEANAQAEKNLTDIARVREQQLQDAAKLQDGAAALKKAHATLFGDQTDKGPVVH